MAEQCSLYISNRDLISNARIRQAVEGVRVQFFAEDEGHTEHPDWIRFTIRWPEGAAAIDRLDHRRPELAARLQERCEWLSTAAGEMDPRQWEIQERVKRTRNLLEMTAPAESAEKLEAFSRAMAAATNGLLFIKPNLYDPSGRVCQAEDGTFDSDAHWESHPSATDRKARSIERLRAEGVPVLESLPPIESNEETILRAPEEVARRASVLVTVAARAEGLDQQRALQFLQGWNLWDAATPKEQAFLLNPQAAEVDRIQFLWRYECLWALLWALGYVERLGTPNTICDVRRAVKTVTGISTDVFISRATLRPSGEVLDEADYIYRCHWAVKNAQLQGEDPPAGLDRGVVIERHVALNWLRAYHSEAWDDVTPDT